MQRRRVAVLLASAVIGGVAVLQAGSTEEQGQSSHVTWVADVLKRMLAIQPGMTRKALLKVFTTEGGLSTRLQRTYVSRNCPYSRSLSNSERLVARAKTKLDGGRWSKATRTSFSQSRLRTCSSVLWTKPAISRPRPNRYNSSIAVETSETRSRAGACGADHR